MTVAEAMKPESALETYGEAGLDCIPVATLKSFVPSQYDAPATKVTVYGLVIWGGRQEGDSTGK